MTEVRTFTRYCESIATILETKCQTKNGEMPERLSRNSYDVMSSGQILTGVFPALQNFLPVVILDVLPLSLESKNHSGCHTENLLLNAELTGEFFVSPIIPTSEMDSSTGTNESESPAKGAFMDNRGSTVTNQHHTTNVRNNFGITPGEHCVSPGQ